MLNVDIATSKDDVSDELLRQNIPEEIAYACRYWYRHGTWWSDQVLWTTMLDFLRRHLLHWFECLNWLTSTGMRPKSVDDWLFDMGRVCRKPKMSLIDLPTNEKHSE